MEKVVKTIICDMCGAEIDTDDDKTLRNSVISGGYYGVPVHEHNPSFKKGLRTQITELNIDLCPACADRATRIHCEVVPADGGRSCRHELSWRDEKPERTCELINAADDLGEGTSSCACFKCGYTALDDWWEEFNYCPNCGAKVVDG